MTSESVSKWKVEMKSESERSNDWSINRDQLHNLVEDVAMISKTYNGRSILMTVKCV